MIRYLGYFFCSNSIYVWSKHTETCDCILHYRHIDNLIFSINFDLANFYGCTRMIILMDFPISNEIVHYSNEYQSAVWAIIGSFLAC